MIQHSFPLKQCWSVPEILGVIVHEKSFRYRIFLALLCTKNFSVTACTSLSNQHCLGWEGGECSVQIKNIQSVPGLLSGLAHLTLLKLGLMALLKSYIKLLQEVWSKNIEKQLPSVAFSDLAMMFLHYAFSNPLPRTYHRFALLAPNPQASFHNSRCHMKSTLRLHCSLGNTSRQKLMQTLSTRGFFI